MEPIKQPQGSSKKGLPVVIAVVAIIIIGALYLGTSSKSVTNNSAVIKNDKLDATVGVNKIPDNWPSDAKVYPNSTITFSNNTNAQTGVDAEQIIFTTSDSAQSVIDFYTSNLTSSGWVSMYPGKAIVALQTGTVTSISAKKDKRFIVVTISDGDNNKLNVTEMITTIPEVKVVR